MSQRRFRRNSQSNSSSTALTHPHEFHPVSQESKHARIESQNFSKQGRSIDNNLTKLIEQDAPLRPRNGLVLMYGPFQAEMVPEQGQGVASWLRECLRKHGIPSLVRYDSGRYAQVFRRDQFQPWLEPLLSKIPG